jgi:hypothetical protein
VLSISSVTSSSSSVVEVGEDRIDRCAIKAFRVTT